MKRVLSIGQCGFDHAALTRVLKEHFAADVTAAEDEDHAREFLDAGHTFDLILVNRVFDSDGADGVDFIRRWASSRVAGDAPLMLVSNFPEAQQRAVEAGARPGFGKSQLHDRAHLIDLLAETLGDS